MEKTIVDEVQEKRLKYFGHVNRRPIHWKCYFPSL